MSNKKLRNAVKEILEYDQRYSSDAYEFITRAVNYTCEKLNKAKNKNPKYHHVSGLELVEGVSEYAREQFGPMAYEVLRNWGIEDSLAIGNVVFNLVDQELLYTSEQDSIEDFRLDLDFQKILLDPFQAQGCVQKAKKPPIII